MNPNTDRDDDLPAALRWQLRGLRRDALPGQDLWPGIAGRLGSQPPQPLPGRRSGRWPAPLALAATVVLAVGVAGWLARSGEHAAAPGGPSLVQLEAEGLTRQYEAALSEVQAPLPAGLRPTVEALDRDAALIREALARDPHSVRLLAQLRRTYARRLALAQRLAYA